METRPRLGRGLAALLRETTNDAVSGDFPKGHAKIPIDFIRSNQRNPRRAFEPEEMEALSLSIKQRGLLQPILVRRNSDAEGHYEIVAGERRWRAAQIAKLHEVSVIILDVTEAEAFEIALIENIQRTNLNPLEEAHGYRTLIVQHNYSQEEVAAIVGKSRSHIANTIRLLNLPEYTKSLLESGALTPGHARALITYHEPDVMANTILSKGLTVREVERLTINENRKSDRPAKKQQSIPTDLTRWERKLAEILGTHVRLTFNGDRGEIRITFRGLDQLEEFYLKLASHQLFVPEQSA